MKMAKASPEEIENALNLAELLRELCDPRNFEMPRWPDSDGDIHGKAGEVFDEDDTDDLRLFYEAVKALAPGAMRVAFGYQVLVDNLCDSEKEYLDLKPEIQEAQIKAEICQKHDQFAEEHGQHPDSVELTTEAADALGATIGSSTPWYAKVTSVTAATIQFKTTTTP